MAQCWNCFREKDSDGVCPHCGYDPAKQRDRYPLALQPGSILNGRYTVGRVLGQGGFGITYIAQDYETKDRLAIKEYLPTELAGRKPDGASVVVYSGDREENFAYGKGQFLAEAKTLAEFVGDEHIVRIHSYFEENGTAYFVMDYVAGPSLDEYMKTKGGRLTPQEAGKLLLPLMASLGGVHAKGIVHRDIAPDNILIENGVCAKLIDFGAARYSTGEKSKSLDVILKHGFAPYEQYLRRGRQGPWTDVYGLAATYYYAITGRVPADATERRDEDTLVSPSELGVKLSKAAETTLKKALAVLSENRYQTMAEFCSDLTRAMAENPEQEEKKPLKPRGKRVPLVLVTVAVAALVLFGVMRMGGKESPVQPPPVSTDTKETIQEAAEETEPPQKTKPPLETETPPKETEQPDEFAPLLQADIGDTIVFGRYEQDNDDSNGAEPVEWLVLDRDGDRLLIISKYALYYRRYNSTFDIITWEASTLRTWLNENFLDDTFTKEEQEIIQTVTVTADDNPSYKTEAGNDTQNKVFLLSIQEAERYFLSDEARVCEPTPYAFTGRTTEFADTGGWWWLRSPGNCGIYAARVAPDGRVDHDGGHERNTEGIRPVVWIGPAA